MYIAKEKKIYIVKNQLTCSVTFSSLFLCFICLVDHKKYFPFPITHCCWRVSPDEISPSSACHSPALAPSNIFFCGRVVLGKKDTCHFEGSSWWEVISTAGPSSPLWGGNHLWTELCVRSRGPHPPLLLLSLYTNSSWDSWHVHWARHKFGRNTNISPIL